MSPTRTGAPLASLTHSPKKTRNASRIVSLEYGLRSGSLHPSTGNRLTTPSSTVLCCIQPVVVASRNFAPSMKDGRSAWLTEQLVGGNSAKPTVWMTLRASYTPSTA